MTKLQFELVIPAYNESKSLSSLLRRAVQAAMTRGYSPETFRVVLVNNGSKDDSQEVIEAISKTDLGAWLRHVHVKVNRGYGWGIYQGLLATEAEYVGWSHADLQCDPDDAFRALNFLESLDSKKQLTIVKGKRYGRDVKDRFVSWVFQVLTRLILGTKITEINAQPKVFHRSLLKVLKNPPTAFTFDLYFLYQAMHNGSPIREFEVKFPPRIHGTSNWAFNFLSRYKTILGFVKYMFELKRNS